MKSRAKNMHQTLLALVIIVAVLTILGFVGGWYLVFKYSHQLSVTKTEADYLQKEAEALGDLELKYMKTSENVDMVTDSLPNNKAISSFLADIESLAKGNNLEVIESIVGAQKTKGKNENNEFSQTVNKEGYYELPIKITFSGSYRSVTNLVDQLTSLRRVTSINGVNIQKTLGNGAERSDSVRAALNLSVYAKKY